MHIGHVRQTSIENVSDGRHVVGATKQLLIGPEHNAPTFAVRLFTLAPGGHTPRHSHPFEHGVVVLEGMGEIDEAQASHPLEPETTVYVGPNEEHQFLNTGSVPLRFLCVVPRHAEG